MSNELWDAVDRYISERLIKPDEAQRDTLSANAAAKLPAIDVSPPQGKLLGLLARSISARKILEIGTLGGYSTVWLARALPKDGRLITLEYSARHAQVAQQNIAREGLSHIVDIRVGPALETLPKIERESAGPFDLVFIDADKENNAAYFAWALKLARPGALIIIDNVVRDGAVVDLANHDAMIEGTRALFDALAAETRVSATAIQTVGAKGWDGFVVALVKES